MRSRLPWQARLLARRLEGSIRERLPRLEGSPPAHFEGEALSYRLEGETLEVCLHRGPCNEIGTTTLEELEQLAALLRAGAGGARAMILHSTEPKGFCAGADLRELQAGLGLHRERGSSRWVAAGQVRGFIDRIHAVFDTIDMAPITTIAALHGFCFGGGFELALCCDLRIADKSTRFAFPELRLGLVPGFGGIPRLARDLGNGVVRDLLLTGRSLSAKRAHEVGLISQLVGRGESLRVARLVAEQAARFDPRTTAAAKRFAKPLPREALEREKDLFIELMASPVVEAALRKFVESDDLRPYLP
ncbi:MAG: enoyl-CoA hydratase/isomerase family protein [Myxococcales bacterium]|nr:enoyl-CoA hydratase/isomerase family protein [Myxococcales bacterium]